jgi:hypothetical protein
MQEFKIQISTPGVIDLCLFFPLHFSFSEGSVVPARERANPCFVLPFTAGHF